MEAYKLSDKEFKIIIIMMFYICKEMKYEQNDTVNKKTENIKNTWTNFEAKEYKWEEFNITHKQEEERNIKLEDRSF